MCKLLLTVPFSCCHYVKFSLIFWKGSFRLGMFTDVKKSGEVWAIESYFFFFLIGKGYMHILMLGKKYCDWYSLVPLGNYCKAWSLTTEKGSFEIQQNDPLTMKVVRVCLQVTIIGLSKRVCFNNCHKHLTILCWNYWTVVFGSNVCVCYS